MGAKYDFSGWATRNDLRCSDGRTIRKNAFANNDGSTVPLVWNHQHNDPNNILGHALLQNRDEGVYAYCTFNDTDAANTARSLVKHGDIKSLSIYANQLKQQGGNVMHGVIREVSLVLAGANPEAFIDSVLAHGEYSDEEAIIFTGEDVSLEHGEIKESSENEAEAEPEEPKASEKKKEEPKKMAKENTKPAVDEEEDDEGETVQDVFDTLSEKQKTVVYALIGQAIEDAKKGGEVKHAATEEDDEDDGEETVQDVFDTLSEKQKTVVYALIGHALEDAKNDNSKGDADMKHNVFDSDIENGEDVLTHSEMMEIFDEAKRGGSLKDAFLAHGIENIGYLYPDAKNLNKEPDFIQDDQAWVSEVMNGIRHNPFSRIKTVHAKLTEADARAKGYVKGNQKFSEIFPLLKRVTTPTTVYKKQDLDRDDIVDITDFDVVAWIKGEMKIELNQEVARAILIGDGRDISSPDKVNEQNIRPIWTDADLYTIKAVVPVSSTATDDQKAKAFIRACRKERKNYKGSGNPVLFASEEMITNMLLMEDTQGHVIYDTMEKLATALRVSKIVSCPVLEDASREVNGVTHALMGILVDLRDYNVGTDKGGEINMFDDFDVDFNQYKYLIETRCSGALVKPYSAIALEMVYAIGLSVDGEDSSTTVLGKTVSSLQSGIIVNDDFIVGTLKYVTDYTGYSGDPDEQKGNFLVLKVNDTTGATTKAKMIGGPNDGREVTLDSDRNIVIRVVDKANQKIRFTTTLNNETVTKTYSFSSLKCITG